MGDKEEQYSFDEWLGAQESGGENSWKDEWIDMPEYNNIITAPPVIVAVIKFRNESDFKLFNDTIKKYLYDGEKPFDGMQRKNVKSTWFPLKEKASKYIYEDET